MSTPANGNGIDPEIVNRNVSYIRIRMHRMIKDTLGNGSKFIDQELSNPLLFAVRPIVKAFYNTFAKDTLSKGSAENVEICIKAALEKVNNPEKDLQEIIDKYFETYLKNDQTAHYCKKSHRNYPWLVENTKKTFIGQVEPLIKMLKCMKDAENYDDLSVKTFKTPQIAEFELSKQLQAMYNGIKKIEQDVNVLDIPVAKDLILNVLKRGFKDTKRELIGDISNIFVKYDP